MSKKPKVRFAANIDGIDYELFWVQERSDKSLILGSAFPQYWENKDNSYTAFSEQHYSIHKSNEGDATTITQKTTLVDGTSVSNVTYIPKTKNQLLWPVYARRVCTMLTDKRKLKSRSKDTVIVISDYTSKKANLLFSVFVTKSNNFVYPNSIKKFSDALETFAFNFGELQIIAIPTYINIPSLVEGDVTALTSSTTITNGVRSNNHKQLIVRSFDQNSLFNVHYYLMNRLKMTLHTRLQNILGDSFNETNLLEGAPSIKQLGSFFTKYPICR